VAAPPALLGMAVAAALLVLAGRYGYHRDELYYLAAGRHPALGYLDQPPLTPLLARAAEALFGDSLTGLRVAPALATGLTVLLTGRIAAELGGGRTAQGLAAAAVAVAAFPLGVGHVLATTTFDLLAWTALSWLLIRAFRRGSEAGSEWLAAGAVAGVGLQNKALLVALPAAVGLGVLAVGPHALRGRGPALGALVALALWAPHVAWQATHGWPQLGMAGQIASVGNGGSEPRWLFPVFQLVLISPLLVPVWAAGLWALARDPALRFARPFAVAYLVLFGGLLAVGGKPYYLAGMYPVLLAAGAAPTLRWARRGRRPARRALLAVAVLLSLVVNAVLMLPLLPARSVPGSPIVAVQPLSAESIGWPELAATVSGVYQSLPADERAHAIVLARNYGEAGAIDTFRRHVPLPPAYSGHNSYADWGPPSESADPVIVVGFDEPTLRRMFGSVRLAARLDNGIGLANDEQGRPVWVCRERVRSWSSLWPELRRLA
jgi:4-amino-4-deoxy-L-arabinose transferase-like glycosyltransferase